MAPFLVGGLNDWGLLALRIMMGAVFIAHGWPKVNPRSPIGGIPGWTQAMVRMKIPSRRSSALSCRSASSSAA